MKLAIIGASTGQLPLCIKAKEMGIQTICFAWDKGATCKDYVDKFYPISVTEKDQIVDVCREERIDGVVSNASDILAEVVAYVSTKLNLVGNNYEDILSIRNKRYMREITNKIDGLSHIQLYSLDDEECIKYPCVVKPISGAAKKGVSYVSNVYELSTAINYTTETAENIIIEQYIEGQEISVETISYKNQHYILQITDKDSTGSPHFVELGHHQPALLEECVRNKIRDVVSRLLNIVGFKNGATHIELKIDSKGEIYLIEINPRGGGDEISSKLVELSTGYDYIKGMIEVALGIIKFPIVLKENYSGIYYLCEQTRHILPFMKENNQPWLIESKIVTESLTKATGNYDRNGYLIYQNHQPRPLEELLKDVKQL